MRDRLILGTCWPSSLAEMVSFQFSERPLSQINEVKNAGSPLVSSFGFNIHVHGWIYLPLLCMQHTDTDKETTETDRQIHTTIYSFLYSPPNCFLKNQVFYVLSHLPLNTHIYICFIFTKLYYAHLMFKLIAKLNIFYNLLVARCPPLEVTFPFAHISCRNIAFPLTDSDHFTHKSVFHTFALEVVRLFLHQSCVLWCQMTFKYQLYIGCW